MASLRELYPATFATTEGSARGGGGGGGGSGVASAAAGAAPADTRQKASSAWHAPPPPPAAPAGEARHEGAAAHGGGDDVDATPASIARRFGASGDALRGSDLFAPDRSAASASARRPPVGSLAASVASGLGVEGGISGGGGGVASSHTVLAALYALQVCTLACAVRVRARVPLARARLLAVTRCRPLADAGIASQEKIRRLEGERAATMDEMERMRRGVVEEGARSSRSAAAAAQALADAHAEKSGVLVALARREEEAKTLTRELERVNASLQV